MADVVSPTSPSQSVRNAPHGKKRAAEGGLESEQRLSKRFDLLNLVDHNGTRLYIPVAASSDIGPAAPCKSLPLPPKAVPAAPLAANTRASMSKPRPRQPTDDCMQVEDTPNRVYIHDLAAELSDVESDDENPIFLQDIEKHLAKLPKHILMGPEPKPTRDNQLVLYNIPSSLSVPEAEDNVRKAIVEARARVRERQANAIGEPDRLVSLIRSKAKAAEKDLPMDATDPDAMDIDT